MTLVMPESERDLGGIERALGLTIPRIHLEGFAYDVGPGAPPPENAKRSTAKSRNAKRSTAKSRNAKNRPRNLATEALRVRIALDDDGMGNARPSGGGYPFLAPRFLRCGVPE